MEAKYITSAYNIDQFPNHDLPEIAFVGRSNVGKSSLVNTLTNYKKLAFVSNTPGKTQTINFFSYDKLCFVDLPGYGFAKTYLKMRNHWHELIESYLSERKNIKLIVLIIDIRHPAQKDDISMKEWLEFFKIKHIVVATKTDKLSNNQISKQVAVLRKSFPQILLFSSDTGVGKKELWSIISQKKI